ncbi:MULTISPECIES: hypothetical protein [Alicyclobacillus]|uniref:Uncharacterized protein n=1 Tax=Alicyclobacillus acidoterrestris (strain ATCC 49025 / DSM 3922 / CIP 106132 / NCIMB 13137 / GD3B) TaxID=1356854 RepID=T0DQ73_ALIAG|nr:MULTISPECIES: hypothetical protein [Alicyclobacillus]EPZ51636.1 hypothetical protein N007_20750 [Alicyclobacillus acidoterrestris ATCC 49025]UNO50479.1 hypothetical protein K1I37_08465 [Alicyclobacillus acidoterrestris]
MKSINRPTILDPKKLAPGHWVTESGSTTKWKHIFVYNDKRRKPIEYHSNSKNPYTAYSRDELLQAIRHVEQSIAEIQRGEGEFLDARERVALISMLKLELRQMRIVLKHNKTSRAS